MQDNNNNYNNSFDILPPEMIQNIFNEMTFTELTKISRVSHFFKANAETSRERKENNISQACRVMRSDPIFHNKIPNHEINNILLLGKDMSQFLLVNIEPKTGNLSGSIKKILFKIKLTNEEIQIFTDRDVKPKINTLAKFLSQDTIDELKKIYPKQFIILHENNNASTPRP